VVLHEEAEIGAASVRESIEHHQANGADGEALEAESLRDARQNWERDYIKNALIGYGWKIQETADSLEINRSHLWKKMRQLGIDEAD